MKSWNIKWNILNIWAVYIYHHKIIMSIKNITLLVDFVFWEVFILRIYFLDRSNMLSIYLPKDEDKSQV